MSLDPAYSVIQTRYHGCWFRSRLEARWAVFFDTMGAEWEYEPEGYRLNDVCYLPDFYLPTSELFVEVKPKAPDVYERNKAYLLSAATKSHVVIVAGIPQSGNRRPGPHFLWVNGADAGKAEIYYCEPCNRLQAHDLWSAKCLWCRRDTTTDHPKLVSACNTALSHRFETPERVNPILTKTKQAPASPCRRGPTTFKRPKVLLWTRLILDVLPKDLDRRAARRDDAVARRPQHCLASVGSSESRELSAKPARGNRFEVVDEVGRPNSRRHVEQGMNVVGFARTLQERSTPCCAQVGEDRLASVECRSVENLAPVFRHENQVIHESIDGVEIAVKVLRRHLELSIIPTCSASTVIVSTRQGRKTSRCERRSTGCESFTTPLSRNGATPTVRKIVLFRATSRWLSCARLGSFAQSTRSSTRTCSKMSSLGWTAPIGRSSDASRLVRSLGSLASRDAGSTTRLPSKTLSTTTEFGFSRLGNASSSLALATSRSSCTDLSKAQSSRHLSRSTAMGIGTSRSFAMGSNPSRSQQPGKALALMLGSQRSQPLATGLWSRTHGPTKPPSEVSSRLNGACRVAVVGRNVVERPLFFSPSSTTEFGECGSTSTTRRRSIWCVDSIRSRSKSSTSKALRRCAWRSRYTTPGGLNSQQSSRARLKALAASSLLWIHAVPVRNAAYVGPRFGRASAYGSTIAPSVGWLRIETSTLRRMSTGAGSAFGEV